MMMMLKQKSLHRESVRHHRSELIVGFVDKLSHVRLGQRLLLLVEEVAVLQTSPIFSTSYTNILDILVSGVLTLLRITVPRFDTFTLL